MGFETIQINLLQVCSGGFIATNPTLTHVWQCRSLRQKYCNAVGKTMQEIYTYIYILHCHILYYHDQLGIQYGG